MHILLHDIISKAFDKGLLTGRSNWSAKGLDQKSNQTKLCCVCLNNTFFFLFTFLAVKHKLIHRPSLFLLNINDISRRKDSDFLFYGDEFCHIIHYKKFDKTDIQLNEYFSNLCDWFTYNEVSIHFGEDGNKYMLFGSKRKLKIDY